MGTSRETTAMAITAIEAALIEHLREGPLGRLKAHGTDDSLMGGGGHVYVFP